MLGLKLACFSKKADKLIEIQKRIGHDLRNVPTTLGHFFFEFRLSPLGLLPHPAFVV